MSIHHTPHTIHHSQFTIHHFLLLATLLMVACGDANTRYVKKAIRIMDKQGIYATGPEWEKTKKEALAATPQSIDEAREIVVRAGKVAGGKHTFLKTVDEVVCDDTSLWTMPTVEILDNGVAVIKLPPFSGNAGEGLRYANAVLDSVPSDLNGVVVDLRGNRGGDMYPMIAAVHRLLPDDNIISFLLRKGRMDVTKSFVLRTVGVEEQSMIECPVALLTDEWTGSSGEVVLICFRGMPLTRSFGSPTAGYASCNQPFALPDGSMLVLTTGKDMARTGEAFCDDPIPPDVMTDTPLEDAIHWIVTCAP